MKYYKILLILFFIANHFIGNTNELQEGYWKGELKLQKEHTLSFIFNVDGAQNITIYNDEERVEMKSFEFKNDSIKVYFLSYANYLIFKVNSKKNITGSFVNPDRKNIHARIKFTAQYFGDTEPKKLGKKNNDLDGKWEVYFDSNTENKYPSIGKFKQEGSKLTGTFLTESGDFRFLNGSFKKNKLILASFDGAHVFLFTAVLEKDTLKGQFLSGSHYKTNWIGYKNETFELEDPDSLTYMVKDTFNFNFKTTKGEDYVYPNENLENKVVIVQILGTWCPNCMDETEFYKELYKEYTHLGLEIIAVAYETPKSFDEKVKRINRYIKNKKIEYPMLVGGHASKKECSEDFHMLNEITSFPTSIFINKQGKVVKIHTGFNGPGTGEIYTDYKKKTKTLIEKLLNE